MKNIIILIGIILAGSISYANQNDKKLNELYSQAKAKYANPEAAREILLDYMKIAEAMNDNQALSKGYALKAFLYESEGNTINAIENYFKSLRNAIIAKDKKLELHNLIRLGHIHYELLDYNHARLFFEEALEKLTINEDRQQAEIIYNLGLIELNVKNYNKAIERYSQSEQLYKSIQESNFYVTDISLDLAVIDIEEKRYEEAIENLNNLILQNPEEKQRLKALNNLGYAYMEQSKLSLARQILEETLQAKVASGGHDLIPTYNNLAKIELIENNRAGAEAHLKLAANEINGQVSEENVWTLNSLITIYEEDQNSPQLLIYYKQHADLLNPLVKLYEDLKILQQQYAAWNLKFQYDLAQERYEVTIQKAIYKGIIIGAVVIILIVASFMIFYKRKHQKLRNKLKQSWERMRKRAIECAAESRKILEEMGYKPGHFKGELPPSLRELNE